MVGEQENVEIGSGMVLDNVGMTNVSVTGTQNKATGGVDKRSAGSSGDCVKKYSRRKFWRSCSMRSVLQDSRVSANITTQIIDKFSASSFCCLVLTFTSAYMNPHCCQQDLEG